MELGITHRSSEWFLETVQPEDIDRDEAMLILNSDHVKSVLTMKDCIEAYRENALGRTVNHRRTHLQCRNP